MTWHGWLTLGVIGLTLAALIRGRVGPDIVLAAAVALLVFAGVLTPGEALAGMAAYPLEVHGTRIGPLAFIGVPLEPFVDLGRAIDAGSPFAMTFVSGYTNGYRNYLPTEAEHARGGYEVDIAAFRPEAAGIFVETSLAVLRELAG